jgi:hypothetical protein
MKPEGALTKRTWDELEEYVSAFAQEGEDRMKLLIIVGTGGLGKSFGVRRMLAQRGIDHAHIEVKATGFGLYCDAYRHLDQPIVIDDVDKLLTDRASVPVLKALCQSDQEKRVTWQTAAVQLDRDDIPHEYVTRSNVCVISNQWREKDRNIQAFQDRGHLIFFEPDAGTVHAKADEWFGDHEIYEFIGKHLYLIPRPSFRFYIKAQERKANGINWRADLIEEWQGEELRRIHEIEEDGTLNTVKQKAQRFVENGWGSRATYFRHKRRLAG